MVELGSAKQTSCTPADNVSKHMFVGGQAISIRQVDEKIACHATSDIGTGTFKEDSECAPECPHCADLLCIKDIGGLGSGSLTVKHTVKVNNVESEPDSISYKGMIAIVTP